MDKIRVSCNRIYTTCNKCLSWSPETAFNSWALERMQTEEVINCTITNREHAFQQILCSSSLQKLELPATYITSAALESPLV